MTRSVAPTRTGAGSVGPAPGTRHSAPEKQRVVPAMRERPAGTVELRGLEPLTPTLPGRLDRVHGGSLRFRKRRDLHVRTMVDFRAQPRRPLTATTTATTLEVRTNGRGLATRHSARSVGSTTPPGRPAYESKLGLPDLLDDAVLSPLTDQLLALLQQSHVDHTSIYRGPSAAARGDAEARAAWSPTSRRWTAGCSAGAPWVRTPTWWTGSTRSTSPP
jgi:hypothetical protein